MTDSTIASIVELATNFGALGIIFYLFVMGKLHSDHEVKDLREDLEAERTAHDLTRQALSLANERANTSALTGELVMRALYGSDKHSSAKAG